MLDAMSDAVIARLALADAPAHVVDAGCGVGGVARRLARRHPRAEVTGLTVVPSQVAHGSALTARESLEARVRITLGDFARTPFATGTLDGAYAIESLCYAEGDAKEAPIAELARVLRRGARFVVADCFRVGDVALPRALRPLYASMCRGWAIPSLPHLGSVTSALRAHGFTRVTADDVSWRVAPSVAHVPFAVAGFLARRWREEGRLSLDAVRRGNLTAPRSSAPTARTSAIAS